MNIEIFLSRAPGVKKKFQKAFLLIVQQLKVHSSVCSMAL